jgi:hypothetical protein
MICTQETGNAVATTAATDVHTGHHGTTSSTGIDESSFAAGHAAHQGNTDTEAPLDAGSCPCCDGCDMPCVLSTSGTVVLSGPVGYIVLSGADTRIPRKESFREGPSPHVLFRPPIFSA